MYNNSVQTGKESLVSTAKLKARDWVLHVDDERNLDNGIIVMLRDGWEYCDDPGCGTRGFDTFREALQGTARGQVHPLPSR